MPDAHRRNPRGHEADRVPDPQRLHRFSKMTASLVAVVTDVVRDGRPVVGYGFNSNGRYGQGGLIRERFRDRILEADPRACSTTPATTSTRPRSGRP
jgi:hypothetical protein